MTNACPTDADLQALVDGSLSAAEHTELLGHCTACSSCNRRLARKKAIAGAFEELGATPVPALDVGESYERFLKHAPADVDLPAPSEPVPDTDTSWWQQVRRRVSLPDRPELSRTQVLIGAGSLVVAAAAGGYALYRRHQHHGQTEQLEQPAEAA